MKPKRAVITEDVMLGDLEVVFGHEEHGGINVIELTKGVPVEVLEERDDFFLCSKTFTNGLFIFYVPSKKIKTVKTPTKYMLWWLKLCPWKKAALKDAFQTT